MLAGIDCPANLRNVIPRNLIQLNASGQQIIATLVMTATKGREGYQGDWSYYIYRRIIGAIRLVSMIEVNS